jgi:hypothetical protein
LRETAISLRTIRSLVRHFSAPDLSAFLFIFSDPQPIILTAEFAEKRAVSALQAVRILLR